MTKSRAITAAVLLAAIAVLSGHSFDRPASAQDEPPKLGFPPLGGEGRDARETVTLAIEGHIDGSDVLLLTQDKATWKHGTFSLPTNVRINGYKWNLEQTKVIPNAGASTYLPADVDFSSGRVKARSGRDIVALEVTDSAATVVFADTPGSGDDYRVTLTFQTGRPKGGDMGGAPLR